MSAGETVWINFATSCESIFQNQKLKNVLQLKLGVRLIMHSA